jgi:hypothetical protein
MTDSFQTNLARYKSLIDANDPTKLAEIQTLNGTLATQLHTMLERAASDLRSSHSSLVQALVLIQNDASIMNQQRDQYKTLQMLRNNEHATFHSGFFWYAIALGIATLLFVLVLMWKGGYKAPMMPTIMTSPSTMPPLT